MSNVERIFDENSKLKDVLEHLKSKNFDIGIVRKNDGSYGYVMREDIELDGKKYSDADIHKYVKNVNLEEKISPDLPLEEVIKKLGERDYLFVFNEDLIGIITYADLNKTPVYTLFYSFISFFEVTLRKIVEKRYENEMNWLKKLSDKNQREIGGIFISQKANGVEISLLECTTLTHLIEILKKDNEWINTYIDNKSEKKKKVFDSKMSNVIDLRNTIMHSRKIINKKDDVEKLSTMITELKENIEKLKKQL